jgi:tetratricopeptide (TPR) repeat protein
VFAHGAGDRALAMGGAYGAVADDATAAFWNPGGMGLVPRPIVSAGHSSLYLGIDEQYVAAVWPSWRYGSFGLTFRHLGVSGLDRRDDRNVVLETDLDNTQTELGFSYGRAVAKTISLGGMLRVQRQSLYGFSDTAVGVDLGVVFRPELTDSRDWLRRFSGGLTLRNVVRPVMRLEHDSVKDLRAARLGLSHWVPFAHGRRILMSFDLEQTRYMQTRLHTGVEAQVHPSLALRAGLDDATFTAGMGVRWEDASLDYAFENNRIDAVHRISASLRFGMSSDERKLLAKQAEEAAQQERLARAFTDRQHEHVETLVRQADVALGERRFDAALELAGTIQVLEPGHPRAAGLEANALLGKAHAHESAGQYSEAGLTYDRILAVTPDNVAAAQGKQRCRKLSEQRSSRTATHQQTFTAALDAFSREDFVRARDGFRAALKIDANDQEAAAMLQRSEEAMRRRAQNLLDLAASIARSGNGKEAQELVQQARALDPQAPQLAQVEADIRRALESREPAKEDAAPPPARQMSDADVHTAVDPEVPQPAITAQRASEIQALYDRGVAARQGGRAEDAIRYWEMVLEADKTHGRAAERLKREYLMRGIEHFAAGNLADAMLLWEKALRIDPKDERALGYMARAQALSVRTQEILGKDK